MKSQMALLFPKLISIMCIHVSHCETNSLYMYMAGALPFIDLKAKNPTFLN